MLFFDIGANIGLYTQEAIQRGYEVIAVEANPNLMPTLTEAVGDSGEALNYIVSNSTGNKEQLFVNERHELSTVSQDWKNMGRFGKEGVYSDVGKWLDPIKVETITLDSLIEKYGTPELIKVDVEEYEYIVITSLTKKVPEICFEWHREAGYATKPIMVHLKKIGFTEFGIVNFGNMEEGSEEVYFERPDKYSTDPLEVYDEIVAMDDESWELGMIWAK